MSVERASVLTRGWWKWSSPSNGSMQRIILEVDLHCSIGKKLLEADFHRLVKKSKVSDQLL